MTGIVMDSGDEMSQTMYIHQGKCIASDLDVVERDFTEHLTKIPTERGYLLYHHRRARDASFKREL